MTCLAHFSVSYTCPTTKSLFPYMCWALPLPCSWCSVCWKFSLFFVSTCPASAHLSKPQYNVPCSMFHEAFSDPTQPKVILSNSIALCTSLGTSFRAICIYGGFCLPWETNWSLEAGLFLAIILIIPTAIYIPSHSRKSVYVHWVDC